MNHHKVTDYSLCQKSKEKIPKDWELRIVVPLFKKGDISNCNNYREMSIAIKVYERIMEKKVREILNKQLEKSQSCFKREGVAKTLNSH